MLVSLEDASKEYLAQELEVTEKALNEALQWQQKQLDPHNFTQLPKSEQLAQLEKQAQSLVLAQAMAEWLSLAPKNEDIMALAEWCNGLAEVIQQHSEISFTLYEQTYLPLYQYLFSSIVALFRNELDTKPDFTTLIRQCQTSPDTSTFAQACFWTLKLQSSHQSVLESLELSTSHVSPPTIIVRELLRPIVRRISFHFLETSPDRVTTTRTEKLPEWLLNYLRQHVLESDSPHELIRLGLSCVLTSGDAVHLGQCFWQEMVRLVQWVLCQRQFFRHPDIAGPRSNPIHLYNAMEQFLLFDRTLRESAPVHDEVLMGLMDTLVMADDDLRQWWIEREREAVFSTLFEDDSMTNVPKPLANHVSPRAEIFCALIRSVQWKASVLTAPGMYLRQVAVPLCSQFVDALHETSTDLRQLMCRPASVDLSANLQEWIEIINGTRLAAKVLAKNGAWKDGMPATSQSDHDLARFGRSLERLVEVMVDELASTFVETILMERAKFASYLMMASHLMASQEWDGDDQDLSAELKETRSVLAVLHQVCNSILLVPQDENHGELSSSERETAQFAPREIQTQIMNRVAEKILEVALDVNDVTPDLLQDGCQIFARDVNVLLGAFAGLSIVDRILDIVQLMTMHSNAAQGLLAALGGLVGSADGLSIHDFSSDETIYDEAMMMLKAKGFVNLELNDAISILNRRRD